ncbi:SPOR domain-containing protein [Balneola sp. MJW-20]|uniref:SPOR domain-containing protein n=1 Tax=Gracilimonas aurantiaca TaxID=3234185 RepID=UPI00346748E3
MHLDHEKLIDLISDTSGISRENVEKQLVDLVEEINQALEDGEAYEIDDFGVFSAMGNNVIFIPADNLETEINYKYVGMEPIEVEDTAAPPEEEPEEESVKDPFAGLLGDVDDDDEDDEEDDIFGELGLGEEDYNEGDDEDDEAEEEFVATVEEPEDAEVDEDVFNLTDEEEDLIPEEAPGPEKWGIDTYKDDTAENVFSGMMGSSDQDEEDDQDNEPEIISSGSSSDMDDTYAEESLLGGEEDFEEDFDDPFAELAKNARSKKEPESAQEDVESFEEEEEEEEEDTDTDVFAGLADLENLDEDDDEEPVAETEKDDEEYVPVVSNVSSDKKKPEKEKKQTEEKKKEYKPRSRSKTSTKQGSPSLILVMIVILIGAGITYGLAYFGVVNIEGITPQPNNVQLAQQNNPPAAQLPENVPVQNETETGTEAEQAEAAQPEVPAVSESAQTETNTPETIQPESTSNDSEALDTETVMPSVAEVDQEMFGLMGEAVAEANSGYTIVLYTLSSEENAQRAYQRLSSTGFRTIMNERDNARYGTVYRISIGQFSSATDAAIAAEDLGDGIPESYIISRIN